MMGKLNEVRLSALPTSDLGCHAAAQITDADATLNTQAGAWRSTSPQQQEIQATAKHEDDWYANEQDRRHLKASRFIGDRTSRRVGVFRDFAATAAAAPAWHAGGPSALPARATRPGLVKALEQLDMPTRHDDDQAMKERDVHMHGHVSSVQRRPLLDNQPAAVTQ